MKHRLREGQLDALPVIDVCPYIMMSRAQHVVALECGDDREALHVEVLRGWACVRTGRDRGNDVNPSTLILGARAIDTD